MKRWIIVGFLLLSFVFLTGQMIIRPYATTGSTLSTGLLAFWKMAETSGTRYDETANNEDLTDNNTVGYGTGKIGNAADFEADNSEYLSKTDDAVLSFAASESFTLGFFLKGESFPDMFASKYILIKSDDSGTEYAILVTDNGTSDVIDFYVYNGANYAQVTSTTALSTGTWYAVICWHNAATDSIYVQINGGSPVRASTGGDKPTDSAGNFVIGGWLYGGSLHYPYDGLIDCFGVWRRCPVYTNGYAMADSIYNGGSGWEP